MKSAHNYARDKQHTMHLFYRLVNLAEHKGCTFVISSAGVVEQRVSARSLSLIVWGREDGASQTLSASVEPNH